MKEKMNKLLIPGYMRTFKCIGSKCEDNCCQEGWTILVDKPTYKKYQNLSKSDIQSNMQKYIRRNRSIAMAPQQYARIDMDDNNQCPFLKGGLCKIQIHLGEGYVPQVCLTYPRMINKVNGILEKSASVSCPEVARRALLDPDILEFYEEIEPRNRCVVLKELNTENLEHTNTINKYFWELRVFSIDLLQNRDYSIEDRLIILGMFYQKVQDLLKDRQIHMVVPLMNDFREIISNHTMRNNLNNIPTNSAVQIKLLFELVNERMLIGNITSKVYLDIYYKVLSGLKYTDVPGIEEVADIYAQIHKNIFKPFIDQHHYLIENYLVNYVFSNLFPYNKEGKVYQEYTMFIVNYCLMKLHLIGLSAYYNEISIENVVKVIYSISRVIEHNPDYQKHVFELLKRNSFDSLAYISILIKN